MKQSIVPEEDGRIQSCDTSWMSFHAKRCFKAKCDFSFQFFVMAVTTAMDDQQCGDDYWPCRCHKFRIFSPFHTQSKTHTEMRTNVHCERADARVITDVFARRDNTRHRDIHDLMIELSPESNSTHLEPDLLKGNRARRIRLICPNHHHRLTIHPEAFRASMDYTWEVFLEGCDLSELDFVFLDNFSALTELYIRHSEIGTFHGLPPSIPLKILDINHCEHGFHWNVSDLPHDLSILRLDRNHLDDKTVAAILRSAARSSLSDLVLSNNMLSRIPDEISTLPTPLRKLKLIGNTIPQIKAESFRFSSDSEIQKRNGGGVHLTVLNLGHVSLKSIQPGTFQPGKTATNLSNSDSNYR